MNYGYVKLREFKENYIKEAEESVIVPEYSTYKEYDAKMAEEMKKGFKTAPTKMFIKMNEFLRRNVRSDWDISVISYQEEKETYIATLNAVEALGIKYIPTIYSYKTDKEELQKNSLALGYGNNINIFLSYYLFNNTLSGLKEKEYIIGHELGHNQNNATAPFILGYGETLEISRYGEYTADRAGMLVCRDVEAATRALIKVSTEGYTEEKIAELAHDLVENIEDTIPKLHKDWGTHPCLERRIAAMKSFASSQMYARLTGLPADSNAISDEALDLELEKIIEGGN